MANAAAVGRTGTPFEMTLERGKIREFADATQSSNPAYRAPENPVIPPTFLTVQMFWQEWSGPEANPWHHVELDQESGMHAEQDYRFFGPPPRAGDRLTAVSRIERIYEKEGSRGGTLTMAEMVTEFFDPSGRLVAEAWMTGVEPSLNPAHAQLQEAK
ncbi:FAS1-like dehydratase domain-containing protein [Aldersonia kunmingensis]|uniref:FAS1-like dehydratase domain-containing protein n=1 Tax=Aldersonia kunmingensis TaxID=408066 RepID=UPI000829C8C7|nr:MaoC family dehydratase N-terminal domain-containing protein [Aldersonia kunmingensis]